MAAGKDLLAGLSQVEVAGKYGVNPSSVCRWNKRLQREGLESLKATNPPGNPSKLLEEHREPLRKILLKGAVAYGYKTDLWTLRRVADVIRKEFGVTYNFRSLGDVLHRMGFSPQKPARRAAERKKAAVQRWLEEQWEKDRKNW